MTASPDENQPPFTQRQIWEYEPEPEAKDTRPWGLVTESANTFLADGGVELTESKLHPGAYTVQMSGVVRQGLPVVETNAGEVYTRSMAERFEAAALRNRGERATSGGVAPLAAYRPKGVPMAHPKQVASIAEPRFGINSRGAKTQLSAEPHSTIIDGESRSLVYPSNYPYTAVCKLYMSYQPTAGAAWIDTGQATGFMIGRSTMMTSGHVAPPAGHSWAIRVVPACWNGQSVFGPGFVSWVRSNWWWNSDSGSDIQICQLFDPIGDSTGYFGARVYDSAWEDGEYWTMAGFPWDVDLTHMSHEQAIAVKDDDDGDDIGVDGNTWDTTQVESDADEGSGASGAPLWGQWGDQFHAIGVHHGVEHDGTVWGTETLSCASGGDGFVAAATWGRNMWG